MIRRLLQIGIVVSVALTASGCFNAEGDYERLKEDKAALAAELATAKRENEVLTRALASIKQEREGLQTLLHVGRSLTPGAASSAGTSDSQPPAVEGVEDEDYWVQSSANSSSSSASSSSAASRATSSGQVYVTRPGDVLSSIAHRHHTTVEKLLELNPFLTRRPNYMIWENDKIQLP